jgi:hypothetical protein
MDIALHLLDLFMMFVHFGEVLGANLYIPQLNVEQQLIECGECGCEGRGDWLCLCQCNHLGNWVFTLTRYNL